MEDIPCTYRISLKAAIKDERGNVMLVMQNDGQWELPGGGMEHGETPKEALARELLEETGLTLTWMSDHPAGFWTLSFYKGSSPVKWHAAMVVYDVKASGTFRANPDLDEAREAKYFSPEEARKIKLHFNTKEYFS